MAQRSGAANDWTEMPGWFDWPEFYRRAVREAGGGDVFVEVGCWLGRSLLFLAQEIRGSGKKISLWGVVGLHRRQSLV
jgi:hypothetical protein